VEELTIKLVTSILAALQLGIVAPSFNDISFKKKYSSYIKEQTSKNSNS